MAWERIPCVSWLKSDLIYFHLKNYSVSNIKKCLIFYHNPGVRCYDTVEGAQCGLCPGGYEGDGRQCQRRSACHAASCYPGVQCSQIDSPPYFRCGQCPEGYLGNGTDCKDEDEVIFFLSDYSSRVSNALMLLTMYHLNDTGNQTKY